MITQNNVIEFINFVLKKQNKPPLTPKQTDYFLNINNDINIIKKAEEYLITLGIDYKIIEKYKEIYQTSKTNQENLTAPTSINTPPPIIKSSNPKSNRILLYMLASLLLATIIVVSLSFLFKKNTEESQHKENNNSNISNKQNTSSLNSKLPFIGKKTFNDFAYATNYKIDISSDRKCVITYETRYSNDVIYNGNFQPRMNSDWGYFLIDENYVYLCDEFGNVRQNCIDYYSHDECECKFSIKSTELLPCKSNTSKLEKLQYPQVSERIISRSELAGFSKWELRIMRNEIYAKYGYIFKSEDLKNYFGQQPWYNPRYNDVSDRLTTIERENAATIKSME